MSSGEARPYVTLGLALREDGSFDGSISSAADLLRVHELREQVDAVAVGGGTWRSDRPRLDARVERLGRAPRKQPVPVVFSRTGVLSPPPGQRPIVVGPSRPAIDAEWLRATSLSEGLAALKERGIASLYVEGGPSIHRALLRQALVDEVRVFVPTSTPMLALTATRRVLPIGEFHRAQLIPGGVVLTAFPHSAPTPST